MVLPGVYSGLPNILPVPPMFFSSATEYVQAMGVGINSDAVKTKPSRAAVKKNPFYYDRFYKRGFRHIRLRVVNDITTNQVDDKGVLIGGNQLLDEIELAVLNSQSAGLLPIVAYGSGQLEESVTAENEEAFYQWWVKCADRLATYDNRVAFNLMIEIGNPLQQYPGVVNRCYARVIDYVRQTQPNRVIFCAPVMLSEPRKLKLLELPMNDLFIGVEIHDYASGPVKDPTHAKYWNELDPSMTAREGNRQRIRDTLNVAKTWQLGTPFPLWFGALLTAPYNKDGGTFTPDEQAVFASFVQDSCKMRNMSIAYNSDDKFIDMATMEWKPEQQVVLTAITGVEP